MLIPPAMTLYFLAGFLFGAAVTIFVLFLMGLLYGLNSRHADHLYADEVDFEEKPATLGNSHARLP
jgi:hypothetical protein